MITIYILIKQDVVETVTLSAGIQKCTCAFEIKVKPKIGIKNIFLYAMQVHAATKMEKKVMDWTSDKFSSTLFLHEKQLL